MKQILFFLTVLILFACSEHDIFIETESIEYEGIAKVINSERIALESIYHSNPNNSLNWNLSDSNINSWEGIVTNNSGAIIQLNLANKNLDVLPPEIAYLSHLTTFYVNGNNLTEIPAQIGKMKNLKRLYAYDNELSDLPVQIAYLKKLTDVYIGFNNFAQIPKVLGKTKSLEVLNISHNSISSILGDVYKLPNLKILGLFNNNISSVSAYIKYLKPTLIELNLGRNELKVVPKEIGELSKLTRLYLHYNNLQKVPSQIGSLINLNILDLRNNPDLNTIPQQICHLNNQPFTTVYLDSWLLCN